MYQNQKYVRLLDYDQQLKLQYCNKIYYNNFTSLLTHFSIIYLAINTSKSITTQIKLYLKVSRCALHRWDKNVPIEGLLQAIDCHPIEIMDPIGSFSYSNFLQGSICPIGASTGGPRLGDPGDLLVVYLVIITIQINYIYSCNNYYLI